MQLNSLSCLPFCFILMLCLYVFAQVTVFNVPTHWSDLGGSLLVLVAVLSMGLEDRVMQRWNSRCL